jgi:hypothetical protein
MSRRSKLRIRKGRSPRQSKLPSGKVLSSGENSAGECVYLVEMDDQQPKGDKLIGTEQLRHGKKWVLSLYPEEVQPA